MDDLVGQAQLGADLAHLVLEQRTQRLDQRELDVVRQPAHVVVALDRRGAGAAAGLDDVRVERPLDEKPDVIVRGRPRPPRASNTRMNSRPIVLRLVSGSVTPASAVRKRSRASTVCSLAPVAATKSFSTCSRSPARSSPWSTNTQVSRSPIARWTSAAATAESTPPDSPQIARPSPTCSRIAATVSSMIEAIVQPGAMPATSCRKRRSTSWPCGECADLGVVLHAGEPALPVLERRDRRPLRRRGDREALGRPARPSRRGSSTPDAGVGRPACSAPASSVTVSSVRPYSRVAGAARPRRRAPAPSPGSRSRCRAPAPRRRTARGPRCGAPWRVHARRAAGEDQRRGLAGEDLGDGGRVRARSRSRPAPPAPGGRSAGRTARRSRRRGPWAAAPRPG